jgi:ribosome biogenesis protein SSF1/2
VNVSGPLGVSHFFIFSTTNVGSYMRIARTPQGPTLTFRILNFSLASDVRKIQENPHSPSFEFSTEPILVMSGFGNDEERVNKLLKATFKESFPSFNVITANLNDCKRVVLIQNDKENEKIYFRHFLITTHMVGISENIQKIVKGKSDVDLSDYKDVSQYILETDAKESIDKDEMIPGGTSAVRLIELGPRLELQLVKIEEKLCTGTVWYHRFVQKTPEEIEELQKKIEARRLSKENRKKEQEQNVAKKKGVTFKDEIDESEKTDDAEKTDENNIDTDDNIEWYKKEVGEDPEEDEKLYLKGTQTETKSEKFNPLYRRKRKRNDNQDSNTDGKVVKKRKKSNNNNDIKVVKGTRGGKKFNYNNMKNPKGNRGGKKFQKK